MTSALCVFHSGHIACELGAFETKHSLEQGSPSSLCNHLPGALLLAKDFRQETSASHDRLNQVVTLGRKKSLCGCRGNKCTGNKHIAICSGWICHLELVAHRSNCLREAATFCWFSSSAKQCRTTTTRYKTHSGAPPKVEFLTQSCGLEQSPFPGPAGRGAATAPWTDTCPSLPDHKSE